MTNEVLTAVKIAGLDPYLGTLHAEEYGRPSLACDLVEEWRTYLGDRLVLTLINRRVIRPDDFVYRPVENPDGVDEADLERIRILFDDLERKRDIAEFLERAEEGDGVRIFIGSENKLFSLSGSSLVVSPYMNADRKIIGAVGVIGPTRLNYGRIVPIVNYTAQLVGRLISDRSER